VEQCLETFEKTYNYQIGFKGGDYDPESGDYDPESPQYFYEYGSKGIDIVK
jgi:hypothetical protein